MKKTHQINDCISLKEKGLILFDLFEEDEEHFIFNRTVNRSFEGLDSLNFDDKVSQYYALVPPHIYPLGLDFHTRQQIIDDYHKRDVIAVGEVVFLIHLGFSLKLTNGRFVECLDVNLNYVYIWGGTEELVLFAGSVPEDTEEPSEGALIQFNNSAYIPLEIPYYSYGKFVDKSDDPFEELVISEVTGKTYKLETESFYFVKEKLEHLYI